jgi:predicted ATP-grasp superfamily ATP-dependent carboligase
MIRRIGAALADAFALRGLFGCDFLLHGGTAWLTEVNPRYAASVEVIEHALGRSLLGGHVRTCLPSSGADLALLPEPGPGVTAAADRRIVGKAILFAPHEFVVSEDLTGAVAPLVGELPSLADIPRAGTLIEAGHPVCTVLAAAGDWETCLAELRDRVQALKHRLFPAGTGGRVGPRTASSFLDQF